MSDHEGVVLAEGLRFQILCRCGWASEWSDSRNAAEATHAAHEQLAEPVLPRFALSG